MEKHDPDSVEVKFPIEDRDSLLHWFFIVLCGDKGKEIIERMGRDDQGNAIARVVVELNGVTVSNKFEEALQRLFQAYEEGKKREAARLVNEKCRSITDKIDTLGEALQEFLETEVRDKLGVRIDEEN